jgi:hypothetical protein
LVKCVTASSFDEVLCLSAPAIGTHDGSGKNFASNHEDRRALVTVNEHAIQEQICPKHSAAHKPAARGSNPAAHHPIRECPPCREIRKAEIFTPLNLK